jgi:5-methylcytosine-specific restriction protein A
MTDRIRGRRLQAIREAHLNAEPSCVMCEAKGRPTAAAEVDHIIALCNGGTDTADNRQSLCVACHRDKTAIDRGWTVKHSIGADGWPAMVREA